MIRERINSDIFREPEPNIPTLDSHIARDTIETEIFDGQTSSSDSLECRISVIPAGGSRTQLPPTTQSITTTEARQPGSPPDKQETSQKDASRAFPICDIIDSSDENTATQESCNYNNVTGNEFKLRRSG